jgi:uncharacterized protein YcfL
MNPKWMIAAIAAAALAAGCASKKGFEQPGFAFGCPVGDAKVASMDDLVKLKVVMEGSRTTVIPTEMRCSRSGDLIRIDANLNNDSRSVKRIAYKFRWIDREGMRAWEEESWKPLLLHENSNLVVNTIAPTNKAADFRLLLRSEE